MLNMFLDFIRSFTLGSNEVNPKCVEFNTPPNAIKLKLKRVNLGNSIMRMTSFMALTK
jgi:hypothetical protein